MGHIGKEHIFRFRSLFDGYQRIFRNLQMFQTSTLFCINVSKEHQNFAITKLFITQKIDVYPFIFASIVSTEIAAKIPNVLANQRANML